MRPITTIFVHCSASMIGNLEMITAWHTDPKPKGNGWSKVGYHYIILRDGTVEKGLPDSEIGIHARGYNTSSIGICLIGKEGLYTMAQAASLRQLLQVLRAQYDLKPEDIRGHYEVNDHKTCPDFDVKDFVERAAI